MRPSPTPSLGVLATSARARIDCDGNAQTAPRESLAPTWLDNDARYLTQAFLTSLPLFVADLLAFACSAALATLAILWWQPGLSTRWGELGLPMALAYSVVAACFGLYPGVGLNAVAEIRLVTRAAIAWFFVFFLAAAYHDQGTWTTEILLTTVCPLLAILSIVFRRLARWLASRWSWWGFSALVFGGGEQGQQAFESLIRRAELGLRPMGIVDDVHDARLSNHLGPFSVAGKLAREHGVFWGVVAPDARSSVELAQLIDHHARLIPHLWLLPDPARKVRGCDFWHDCSGFAATQLDERLLLPGPRAVKRAMDLVFTTVGGALLLPVLLAIAIAIRLNSRGSVFYSQRRIGRGGQCFNAWKFRTMVVDADRVLSGYLARHPELREEWERNHKLKSDPRITAVGQFLRRTSLDELPQLWNVLRGEMSLVGPRPIVEAEIEKYASTYSVYLRVRPGLTGLWQVSGRSNTTYAERVQLDDQYVRNWSPSFDLCLLARTVPVVFLRHGAY